MARKRFFRAAAIALAMTAGQAFAADNGPSDLEIAHTAYTAGEIDIRYAHLALALSDNADVRAFAETMVRDHSAVNRSALALLEKLKASPQDNETSRTLNRQAAQKRAELIALKGAQFDKAYASNELAYHQFVNKTLADALIPATDNAELKALLQSALKTFQTHEGHAAKLAGATK
jgi:putative membrane protein